MTPLNSILNLTDLLMFEANHLLESQHGSPKSSIKVRMSSIEDQLDMLKTVSSSATMMKLINQSLLDIHAINDDNFKANYVQMSPHEKIEELLKYFKI